MQEENTDTDNAGAVKKSERLYYLDWLLAIAILGVIIFHAIHPFDELGDFIVKNAERSILATFVGGFLNLWGMPFFFLMAGATTFFSLRIRTVLAYVRERINRLLIPFIIGSIILTPIQAYFAFVHRGWWQGNFFDFLFSNEMRDGYYTLYHPLIAGPEIFGRVGYHLWFIAFLFLYAIIALPFLLWLKKESGVRFVDFLTRISAWRGGLLLFVVPAILISLVTQTRAPSADHGWADFVYFLLFFISGYIMITNDLFLKTIRRDWWIYLCIAIPCTAFFFLVSIDIPVTEWMGQPGNPLFYLAWTLYGINAWCWIMVVFQIGMRFLDFSNKLLGYLREAVLPVFFIHQPVIALIAFYVVQWELSVTVKLLIVVIGSAAVSIGMYEVFVRHIRPVRALFGIQKH